jgi:hypothetical protein
VGYSFNITLERASDHKSLECRTFFILNTSSNLMHSVIQMYIDASGQRNLSNIQYPVVDPLYLSGLLKLDFRSHKSILAGKGNIAKDLNKRIEIFAKDIDSTKYERWYSFSGVNSYVADHEDHQEIFIASIDCKRVAMYLQYGRVTNALKKGRSFDLTDLAINPKSLIKFTYNNTLEKDIQEDPEVRACFTIELLQGNAYKEQRKVPLTTYPFEYFTEVYSAEYITGNRDDDYQAKMGDFLMGYSRIEDSLILKSDAALFL